MTETPLFPLLTINSGLYQEVERALYRHIDLSGDTRLQIKRRIGLFRRLSDQPQVGLFVESFVLSRLKTDRYTDPISDRKADEYSAALQRALCAMTNLRSLTIEYFAHNKPWAGTWKLEDLFQGCQFRSHQLDVMSFIERGVDVMGGQLWIEDLAIDHQPEPQILHRALPRLRVLQIAPTSVGHPINALRLPSETNRSIVALHWTSWQLNLQAGPFPQMRSLRLSILENFDVNLLCTTFPFLHYLRLDFWKIPVS